MLRTNKISRNTLFSLLFCSLFVTYFGLASVRAEAGIIRDTEIEFRLRQLSLPLAQQAGFADGVHFTIVADHAFNAFVAGRDRIYIHTGLLLNAETDGEILGVIAHEIGHLSAGHVPRRDQAIANANLATALTTLAAIATTATGDTDAAAGIIIGGTDRARRNYLASSRVDEAVADEWALMAMDNAGFSSEGLSKLMRRLSRQRALPQDRQSEYYSTHPNPELRLSAIEDHVQESATTGTPIPETIKTHLWRIRAKLSGYNNTPLTRALQTQIDQAEITDEDDILTAMAYREAIRSYRRGSLDKARLQIDALLTEHANDPFFHELSGEIAFASGDTEAAAEAYRKALTLFPNAPQIALSLGRVLVASGNPAHLDEAVQMLERAVKGEPSWAFARRELGIAYGRSGRLAHAHLSLAEEALLRGALQDAINLSERALRVEAVPDDVEARARDILFHLSQPLQ